MILQNFSNCLNPLSIQFEEKKNLQNSQVIDLTDALFYWSANKTKKSS